MDKVLGVISVVFFVIAVVYLYIKVNRMKKLTNDLGEKVQDIFPGKVRQRAVFIFGIAFILIAFLGTIGYLVVGEGVSYTTVVVMDLVLFAAGRYISRFVIMYQNGLLAHLHVVKYHEIRSYTLTEMKSKKYLLELELQKDSSFRTIVAKKDKDVVEKALKKAI